MDKQLLNNLYAVKKAIESKEKTISEKCISDVDDFINKEVKANFENTEAPVEPQAPLKKEVNFKEPVKPYEPYKPSLNYDRYINIEFKPPKWMLIAFIVFGLIGLMGFFAGMNSWNDIFGEGLVMFIMMVGGFGSAVLLYLGYIIGQFFKEVFGNASANRRMKKEYPQRVLEYEENYKKYLEELDKYNSEVEKRNKAIDECEKEYSLAVAEYKKQMETYQKDLDAYQQKQKEFESYMQEANEKRVAFNSRVIEEANKVLAEEIDSLGFYYPETYFHRIDDIIKIIKDARADTLKEAIEKLIEDDRRTEDLLSQHIQSLEQERRLEEIKKNARMQCADCANRISCPASMQESLTGPCPNFIYDSSFRPW